MAPDTRRESGLVLAALTGGIATGKSYCLQRFAALGIPVADADVFAREAVEPGTAGLAAVRARFGPAVVTADGRLDRAALARIVFADDRARRDLEAIVHPYVYERIARWGSDLALQGPPASSAAIADVPLLFETGHAGDFDAVIVAACRPEQQVTRLMARDGLTGADARQRISAQIPIDDKRTRADYVIDTSGSEAETDRQIDEIASKIKSFTPRRTRGARRP